MNLSPIKRALLALALCLAVGACARGRRFERFPAAIDHDRLEQRLDAIRADERDRQRVQTAANTLFVELNLHQSQAAQARLQGIRRREAAKRAELQRQFEEFRARGRTTARASAGRQFTAITARVKLDRDRRLDVRAAATEALLTQLRRAEARLEFIRRRRLERRQALLERTVKQAARIEAKVAAVRSRQQRIVERERASRQALFEAAN